MLPAKDIAGRRAVGRALMGTGLAAGVLGRLRQQAHLPRPLTAALSVASPAAFTAGAARGRGRAAVTWLLHMNAYEVLFALPYDKPERLRRHLHEDFPRRLDAIIGLGIPVPQRLQEGMRRNRARLTAFDRLVATVYWSWEVVPHLALGWVLWRHPHRFVGDALRLGAMFDMTLVPYTLMPATPPWWSALKDGHMNGHVRRLADEVLRTTIGKPQHVPDENRGSNPWCTMPSNHVASTVMLALILAEIGPVPGALAVAYAFALAFALVYLGEHYLGDVLAGTALAILLHRITRPLES